MTIFETNDPSWVFWICANYWSCHLDNQDEFILGPHMSTKNQQKWLMYLYYRSAKWTKSQLQ